MFTILKQWLKKLLPISILAYYAKYKMRSDQYYDQINQKILLDRLIGKIENSKPVQIANSHLRDVTKKEQLPSISFLVGTSDLGLLLVQGEKVFQLIAGKGFYGISKFEEVWYAFQKTGKHGRIISFQIENQIIYNVQVKLWGLSRGIHQIDFIGNDLIIIDTYFNRIIRYKNLSEIFNQYWKKNAIVYYPAGKLKNGRKSQNYKHFNSIFKYQNNIYLVAHNETYKTGNTSEIYILDQNYQIQQIQKTNTANSHNIYIDNKFELACDSWNGTIQNKGKDVINFGMFMRGLSIANDFLIFGGSELETNPSLRSKTKGVVFATNKEFSLIASWIFEGTQIHEIRRVDVCDYSLSNESRS